MTQSSKTALGAAGLLLIILIGYVLLHLPQPSNRQQIIAQMEFARLAAQDHDPNGVMKIVSADYTDSNGLNNDQLAFALRRFTSRNQSVQISMTPPSVQVTGSTAVSSTQVNIQDAHAGQVLYSMPLTLHWKKADGTKWLVFPAKVWEVTSANYTASPNNEGAGSF